MSDENRKQLTPEQRKRIEQFVVKAVAGLVGIVILWFILAPDFSSDESIKSGFNTTIPDAVQSEMADDKQAEYEKEKLSERDAEREEIKALAEQLIKEDKQKVEVIPPSKSGTTRPNYHKPQEPKDKIIASTEAYRDMNKTLGGFYDEPKNKVDPEKEAMQEELDELKEQLAQQEQIKPTMGVDEQIALMEKSYELAAKYMPSGQSGQPSVNSSTITTPEIGGAKNFINGKAQVNVVGQVHKQVVSTLSEPMSDSTFIAKFSKSRNWGFNTAVGSELEAERNTISVAIHSDQTVTDGQSIRLRLLEPMRAGSHIIPKQTLITGMGKIQGERLSIFISSLEYQGMVIPVELTIYDSDGQEGIFIPSSMEINAAKEIAANMGTSLGTSINITTDAKAQLLSDLGKGLIQGTSTYISKKIKIVKVHLKAGYKLMLYQKGH